MIRLGLVGELYSLNEVIHSGNHGFVALTKEGLAVSISACSLYAP